MFAHRPLTLASAVALSLNAAVAHGQGNTGNALALEEVIVTATKREQNLQDVAVAVTALTDEMLLERQLISTEELVQLVPSLTLQRGSNPRQTSFNIRGIGTQSFSTAVEPSVSTMVDGVVMGRSGQAFVQLLDVERVEVLRGPQGTLFGKNSTAGVVHIVTKNPTEEHTGELMGAILTEDEYRAGVTFSGPITDNLGYRLTASADDTGGWIENVNTGNDLNGSDNWNVRGKLRWTGDDIEIKWASDYGEGDCECTASPIYRLDPFDGNEVDVDEILDRIAPVVPGDENVKVNHDKEGAFSTEQWGHSLEVNWDIGEHTLTSITALRQWDIGGKADGDLDSQPIRVLGFDQSGATEQEQFTQEIRITSPADGVVTYVAGLFYFDQTVERQFIRSFEIVPGSPGEGIADFEADTENWAVFGEATWNITDELRLLLGARYTEDDLQFEFGRIREGFPVGVPDPVERAGQSTDEDDLSGKVAVQWDFSDAGMVYLSFVQGYKGPAFDLTFGTNPLETERIDPETSDSWELGMKSTLLDGQLILNAALFHSVYDDFQSQAFFDPDGLPDCPDDNPGCDPEDDPGGFFLINAGEVQTQGLELDVLYQATENLRLSGGLAYVDASIEEYDLGNCSDGQKFRGECPEGLQDLAGGDLPHSPDWKINLTAAYTWNRDSLFDVIFVGGINARDEVQYSLSQDENTIGDELTLVDLSARLSSHSDTWDATFFIKNATDEFYSTAIYSAPTPFLANGYGHRVPKQYQRTYGLDLRYRW